MSLTSKSLIKDLLKKYKARPLKRLGQNFLIDKSVLQKIIESANLHSKDIVLEIGPGVGILTQEITKRVKKVITIEKDQKMVEILKETLKDFKNIEIIQEDVLKSNIQNLISNIQYKIVANLPYYIVSPVIRKFLELPEARPLEMVLMVQKEVAQRICARPPKMSILAVSVQFYAKPEIISFVSKKSFWPQPKVDSGIVKITPKTTLQRTGLCKLFFKIVKAGFSHPRKQIVNNLSKMLKLNKEKIRKWLLKNGIEPIQRAETLTVKDWLKLTRNWYKI
ncbi:ribosomal RNA small subunit methyltransferase A [Patescibacteria group bacterium]|nr:ribosomal RNA small subunit methyltransferase A [Patescibacteria group bacterium]